MATRHDLRTAATHLASSMAWLRVTPIAGGRRSVVAVREFYKFAAAEHFVYASVLAALYEMADDRHLPGHLSVKGPVLAMSLGKAPGQTGSPGESGGLRTGGIRGQVAGCPELEGSAPLGLVVVYRPENRSGTASLPEGSAFGPVEPRVGLRAWGCALA